VNHPAISAVAIFQQPALRTLTIINAGIDIPV
jgi:hypothetical protein